VAHVHGAVTERQRRAARQAARQMRALCTLRAPVMQVELRYPHLRRRHVRHAHVAVLCRVPADRCIRPLLQCSGKCATYVTTVL
jgi:hypothetical protein